MVKRKNCCSINFNNVYITVFPAQGTPSLCCMGYRESTNMNIKATAWYIE